MKQILFWGGMGVLLILASCKKERPDLILLWVIPSTISRLVE